jgi:integrase
MSSTDPNRRSYGTGSLYTRADSHGRETWYARWHTAGRRVKRRIGPKRMASTRDGLTRPQAEAELRRLIAVTQVAPRVGERLTVADVSERYREHAERAGRKRATVVAIESETRMHLEPFFGDRAFDAISSEDVADFVTVLEGRELAPKTIRNIVGTLSALFNYAKAPRRRWATVNPCEGAELPAVPERSEIRFLDLEEVDLLAANALPGPLHAIDRALYRVAPMTGLRLGELAALRWTDVDWTASRIRVRRNYVLGEFGTPKSRRATRSVPLADEAAQALEHLFGQAGDQRDDALVFADPRTGGPLDKSNVTRRMRSALRAAGLDDGHCFHDLRHTFGTRMAAAGVPMRTLMEWMGHKDLATTLIYADFQPGARDAQLVAAAFARGPVRGPNLSEPQLTSQT